MRKENIGGIGLVIYFTIEYVTGTKLYFGCKGGRRANCFSNRKLHVVNLYNARIRESDIQREKDNINDTCIIILCILSLCNTQ